MYKPGMMLYEFVPGIFLTEFIEKSKKSDIKKVLIKIFEQMYQMDKLKITKFEMHKPYKHIVINKTKPILLDFERCHKDLSPKNVTQFCQCITHMEKKLKNKGFKIPKQKIRKLAQKYKNNMNQANFNTIISLIK
jgi:putative serine/threonine protein kinase